MKELKDLCRKNIWNLAPYSSARDEYSGHEAHVFLDANENPYNTPYNRYPDPLQRDLKAALSKLKNVPAENIFLGNGSDEAIDLCYRVFCNPGIDNVVAIEPTYGMYKVCADINDVEYRPVLLDEHFQINAEKMLDACDEHTKLIWICSPNNPTGNLLDPDEIHKLLDSFQGIVVIDEAYADFALAKCFRTELQDYPNMIVLNTMSKAWGCAAIRLGMAFASTDIIGLFNKVKYPYNINILTQKQALAALNDKLLVDKWIRIIRDERNNLMNAFSELPICDVVYPSNANFFLAKMSNAEDIYNFLVGKGIIVRNRSKVKLCGNCLRITIGKRSENQELVAALREYYSKL